MLIKRRGNVQDNLVSPVGRQGNDVCKSIKGSKVSHYERCNETKNQT